MISPGIGDSVILFGRWLGELFVTIIIATESACHHLCRFAQSGELAQKHAYQAVTVIVDYRIE